MRYTLFAGILFCSLLAPFAVTPALARHVDVIVDVAPPELRYEVVPAPRHGRVWVPGYWYWSGRHHVWHRGYWVSERRGWHYVNPRWEHDHGRWHYYDGRWER